jgi:nicotinamide mononucleotide transporter
MVNVAVYTVVFARARLYADAGLQVVYFVMSAYGWWAWLRGAAGHELPVTRAPRRVLFGVLAAAALATAVLGGALRHGTDAALPWLDAGTTSFSLAAQLLMTRKWIENWVLWIAVDVVYVYMYVVKDLHATALLYTLFLALAVSGLLQWRRSLTATSA